MADTMDRETNETNVEVVLAAIEFPAGKDELVEAAQGAKMDKTVVMFFEALPDQRYQDRKEVDKAIEQKKADDQKEMGDHRQMSTDGS